MLIARTIVVYDWLVFGGSVDKWYNAALVISTIRNNQICFCTYSLTGNIHAHNMYIFLAECKTKIVSLYHYHDSYQPWNINKDPPASCFCAYTCISIPQNKGPSSTPLLITWKCTCSSTTLLDTMFHVTIKHYSTVRTLHIYVSQTRTSSSFSQS